MIFIIVCRNNNSQKRYGYWSLSSSLTAEKTGSQKGAIGLLLYIYQCPGTGAWGICPFVTYLQLKNVACWGHGYLRTLIGNTTSDQNGNQLNEAVAHEASEAFARWLHHGYASVQMPCAGHIVSPQDTLAKIFLKATPHRTRSSADAEGPQIRNIALEKACNHRPRPQVPTRSKCRVLLGHYARCGRVTLCVINSSVVRRLRRWEISARCLVLDINTYTKRLII